MTTRRIIPWLIVLTVVVFSLVAARKLTATPKYDRIQVGMAEAHVSELIGTEGIATPMTGELFWSSWDCDEGVISVGFEVRPESNWIPPSVDKSITRRGPLLERLAWLAGWR